MHGLINFSIQCFVQDTYDLGAWGVVATEVGLGPEGFEAMLNYPDTLTCEVLDAVGRALDKPREAVLEDLGNYLVCGRRMQALRRLLRFGGETFAEFLHSLSDLADRARLAVPDLDFPKLDLRPLSNGGYRLDFNWHVPGTGHLLQGFLRAMADDYGVLALLECYEADSAGGFITVELLDSSFADGRRFDLALPLE